MKKSSFITLILGVASGLIFSLGMCMALLPEWNLLNEGILVGGIGLVLLAVTVGVWRKLSGAAPVRFTQKGVLSVLLGVAGALTLGVGMCLCLVWTKYLLGTLIGIVGIILLLCLIPLMKGFTD